MSILTVQHLEKHFENTKVLNDISFSLEEGQALSIIGSSGSGKTTLLRCLNFLETPDAGTITVQDKVLFDADHHANCSEKEIRKNRLHFGMVFQSFNLFPQYTALENVTLARELMAKDSGESKEAIRAAGMELLDQMGFDNLGELGSRWSYPEVESEELVPDIIFYDSQLDPEQIIQSPVYSQSPAVLSQQLIPVDFSAMRLRGLPMIDQLAQMAQSGYPQAYGG